MIRFTLFLCLALAGLARPAVAETPAQPPLQAAFFGLHFINTTQDPDDAVERERTKRMEAQLMARLIESGRYVFIDPQLVIETASARLARYSNVAHCNGCDVTMARELGADVSITGEIQKTSNLILHITLYIRSAETGGLIGGGSADIRGNTEESWRRGVDYIIRNRILRAPR